MRRKGSARASESRVELKLAREMMVNVRRRLPSRPTQLRRPRRRERSCPSVCWCRLHLLFSSSCRGVSSPGRVIGLTRTSDDAFDPSCPTGPCPCGHGCEIVCGPCPCGRTSAWRRTGSVPVGRPWLGWALGGAGRRGGQASEVNLDPGYATYAKRNSRSALDRSTDSSSS